jgi:hypothetical protein
VEVQYSRARRRVRISIVDSILEAVGVVCGQSKYAKGEEPRSSSPESQVKGWRYSRGRR